MEYKVGVLCIKHIPHRRHSRDNMNACCCHLSHRIWPILGLSEGYEFSEFLCNIRSGCTCQLDRELVAQFTDFAEVSGTTFRPPVSSVDCSIFLCLWRRPAFEFELFTFRRVCTSRDQPSKSSIRTFLCTPTKLFGDLCFEEFLFEMVVYRPLASVLVYIEQSIVDESVHSRQLSL